MHGTEFYNVFLRCIAVAPPGLLIANLPHESEESNRDDKLSSMSTYSRLSNVTPSKVGVRVCCAVLAITSRCRSTLH